MGVGLSFVLKGERLCAKGESRKIISTKQVKSVRKGKMYKQVESRKLRGTNRWKAPGKARGLQVDSAKKETDE